MAAVDMGEELTCSICLSIYTDPVTLPCGHYFCQGCIGKVLDTQEESGGYSCPECRAEYQERPALQMNRKLGNIAERFISTHPEQDRTGIFCTYCIHAPVPAAKSCLLCEASLCDAHVRVHSKSAEHVLTEPTTSLGKRKCSVHNELLKYYCCEDGVCICVSCCLAGEHRGHRVELLNEASEKKKEKLRNVLEKLKPEREQTMKKLKSMQCSKRRLVKKTAGETERITALFRVIREQLEVLEKRHLSDIFRQKEEIFLQLWDLMEQLEIKKDELSRKIHHIEELCNMADPLTVLQEQESDGAAFCGAEGADNEDRKKSDIKVPAVGDLDELMISETLLTDLAGIVTGVKETIYGQEATDMLLDINTAGKYVDISEDKKSASCAETDQGHPQTPDSFQYAQVLSTTEFSSGRHYWEVEGSESQDWGLGVSYRSIEKQGLQSVFGKNNKSWCLYQGDLADCITMHDSEVKSISPKISCNRFRISLDYEAGRLSFYELSEPIRHLHTLTTNFTEPLHAAFGIWMDSWVRIIS